MQWRIESGFAGLEKAKPASHAQSDRPNYCSERWDVRVQLLANRESIISATEECREWLEKGPSMWELGRE